MPETHVARLPEGGEAQSSENTKRLERGANVNNMNM